MKEKYDPNKSFVNLTYKCNNRCISCIMPHRVSQEEKSLGGIKTEIKKILKNSYNIGFNGGEPTLNPHLFKILNYTNKQKRNIEVSLLSNARMFSNLGYLNKLKLLRLRNFKIVTTLYGPNAKIHDAITRTPDSFDQQIRAIKNLIHFNIKIDLRIVINKLNYKYLDDMAKFIVKNFNKEDFLSIALINMKICGEAYKNRTAVVCKIIEIMPHVKKSAKRLLKNKFKVYLLHFPHCVLPKTLWFLSKGVTAEKTEICFLPECKHCLQKKNCSGIWKGYCNLFGDKDFQAIKKTR